MQVAAVAPSVEEENAPPSPDRAQMVSVVIPCYNQGRYLGDAIASVLRQTYRNFEIVVIDDGSTDNTPEIARMEPRVRCFSQPNQGLSAARNRGIREGRGAFFVFLDADDRLLPAALETAVAALRQHPDCAFAYGDYRDIDSHGNVLLTPERPLHENPGYASLLRGNSIEMHATVIYRRDVFQQVGLFSIDLRACEDYDLYLRIARQMPICHFPALVAEYRLHSSNMSRDPGLMLRSVLEVLHAQSKYVRNDGVLTDAYKEGLRVFAATFAVDLARQSWANLFTAGRFKLSLRGFLVLMRCYPFGIVRRLCASCLHRLSSRASIESRIGRRLI